MLAIDGSVLAIDNTIQDKETTLIRYGYESYNVFEHVVKSGQKYLIRVKDIDSKTSMTRSLGPFPEGEFDIDVFRMLTLKQNKIIRACPQLYKYIPTNARFDFMSKEEPWYEFNCRIVRFKISDDTYECIITNLDREEFSMEDIQELYNKCREIKHHLDRSNMHLDEMHCIQRKESSSNRKSMLAYCFIIFVNVLFKK